MRRSGLALLAVMSVALAGIIWLELRPEKTISVMTQEPVRAASPVDDKPVATSAGHDEAAVVRILTRPLFQSTRRPAARRLAAVPAAPPPSLPRLAGIVMDGDRRSVIFAPQGDSRSVTVPEGGRFNEFQVESITAGQVTVTGVGTRQVLRLSFDPNPPPVPVIDAIASPNFLAPPGPNTKLPTFNGPPGLANMPKAPSDLPIAAGVAPGLPSPSALSGIPGLSVPAATDVH